MIGLMSLYRAVVVGAAKLVEEPLPYVGHVIDVVAILVLGRSDNTSSCKIGYIGLLLIVSG